MEISTIIQLSVLVVVGIFILSTLLGSFFTIKTSEVGIVERFSKFYKVADAGLNWKTPFITRVANTLSLRVQQLSMDIETKTKDNVFVTIRIAVQYEVMRDKVSEAYYRLTDPSKQITAYIYNVILGHVPTMSLDDVFVSQTQIAQDVKASLDASMQPFGYRIVRTLIEDVVPADKVKSAMNDIQAAVREREATVSRAETEKLLRVKQAEAEKESKILQGQGIAGEREAIINGLKKSVEDLAEATGVEPSEAMGLVVMTQYFDTLAKIGASSNTNTLMLPHSPSALPDFMAQIRTAITTGEVLSRSAMAGSRK